MCGNDDSELINEQQVSVRNTTIRIGGDRESLTNHHSCYVKHISFKKNQTCPRHCS